MQAHTRASTAFDAIDLAQVAIEEAEYAARDALYARVDLPQSSRREHLGTKSRSSADNPSEPESSVRQDD
jgi:hypothetical protein